MYRTALLVVVAIPAICLAQFPRRPIMRPPPRPIIIPPPGAYVPAPPVVVAPAPAPKQDVVLRWCNVTLEAIKAERTPPPVAARNLAVVHVAMYDAVCAVDRIYQPFHVDERAATGASVDAAAAAAAYRTLVTIYPRQIPAFNEALRATLVWIPTGPGKAEGFAMGELVAKKVLDWRDGDRTLAKSSYAMRDELGHWQPTPPDYRPPLLPQWAKLRPFALKDDHGLHPPEPPAVDSKEFIDAYRRVKEIGGKASASRTAEQSLIAKFWADGEGTVTPPGHWNRIASHVAEARKLTTIENARLFAMLNVALADVAIACWDCKYKFDLWRPVTAIRKADALKNPALTADADWEPLLTTPPFPAYTSGHSSFSGAAAVVLAAFFGADKISFVTTSDDVPGKFRRFDTFSAAADEAGMSRIYGGIHWDFDNTGGLAGGKKIGECVSTNFFKKVN